MEFTHSKKEMVLALSLILLAVASRLLPHPPNFAPITGIALFASTRFQSKILALMVPFIAMVVTDWVLGFSAITLFVYLAFAVIFFQAAATKKIHLGTLIISSLLFFVITNLGVWYLYYPHSWEGLSSCFLLALPFYTNTLLGDLFYTGVLFGSFSTLRKWYSKPI